MNQNTHRKKKKVPHVLTYNKFNSPFNSRANNLNRARYKKDKQYMKKTGKQKEKRQIDRQRDST